MVLALQAKALGALDGRPRGAEAIAAEIGAADEVEIVWKILEHAADNRSHGVVRSGSGFEASYSRT